MFAPAHLRVPRRDRAILGGPLVALAVAAWLALWLWEGSPYGHYLHHAGGGGPLPLEAALFAVGWLLMIVAMMLPSSVPLVVTFGALVRPAPPAGTAGRAAARRLPRRLGRRSGSAAWLARSRASTRPSRRCRGSPSIPQVIIATTLAVAGLWQFSPLRDRCLDECRSPLGFVINRWRGTSERREAFAMGIAHGAFCVGCCWSLMLVMFGVGLGSLSAMLALGGAHRDREEPAVGAAPHPAARRRC